MGRTLLEHLSRSAELIGQALVHTAVAAWLEEAAAWSGLTAQELAGWWLPAPTTLEKKPFRRRATLRHVVTARHVSGGNWGL
ncbi:hypothetical protein [Streptomyces sp. 604F]|uniref:hypothetical protein n=1 Tax=Streptomyces sp. 604F TaxID=1476754 RepID=UPI0019418058|nr:hypothetical protein [Streptomyces sp. 604F]